MVPYLVSFLDFVEELRTLLLEELTVRVVVLERNTILLHNIVVESWAEEFMVKHRPSAIPSRCDILLLYIRN
jgi:hypothetical protein